MGFKRRPQGTSNSKSMQHWLVACFICFIQEHFTLMAIYQGTLRPTLELIKLAPLICCQHPWLLDAWCCLWVRTLFSVGTIRSWCCCLELAWACHWIWLLALRQIIAFSFGLTVWAGQSIRESLTWCRFIMDGFGSLKPLVWCQD